MPNDDFSPDLSKLDKDYQVLTELHREGDSRTYLARHLELNRDVTVTVVRAPEADESNVLTHFAADARLLMTMRHPNVVPVIEGLWLDEKTFAIVRARVRGSTLDQLIGAVGPVPIARVASTIREVNEAVAWARAGGVVHRHVLPRDIVFQQGSGRVLLSFEPSLLRADALPDEHDDADTIGQLTADMLWGEINGRAIEPTSTGIAPAEVIPSVVEAIEAVSQADAANASAAIASLLAALDAAAAAAPAISEPIASNATQSVSAAPSPTIAAPIAAAAVTEPAPVAERVVPPVPPVGQRAASIRRRGTRAPARSTVPVGAQDDAVVVLKPSFGFNARLATAIAVVAIVAVLGLLVLNRGDTVVDGTASVSATDTMSSAAGDVAPKSSGSSSSVPRTRSNAPTTIPSAGTILPRSPIVPPDTPRHEPPRTTPSVTMPLPRDSAATERKSAKAPVDSVEEAERKFKRDSAADVADVCLSPESANQHKCLMNAIDRNDRELNGVYARVITALRRQAGAASADPDPDTVEELRAGQRKWVDERDAACRDVGEGPLYAKSRSACFAQESANRVRELRRILEAIPPSV